MGVGMGGLPKREGKATTPVPSPGAGALPIPLEPAAVPLPGVLMNREGRSEGDAGDLGAAPAALGDLGVWVE